MDEDLPSFVRSFLDEHRTKISRIVGRKLSITDKLACGGYGCVYKTTTPGVVCKITSDPGELIVAEKFVGQSVRGLPRFYHVIDGIRHDGMMWYLIWREYANHSDRLTEMWNLFADEKNKNTFDNRAESRDYDLIAPIGWFAHGLSDMYRSRVLKDSERKLRTRNYLEWLFNNPVVWDIAKEVYIRTMDFLGQKPLTEMDHIAKASLHASGVMIEINDRDQPGSRWYTNPIPSTAYVLGKSMVLHEILSSVASGASSNDSKLVHSFVAQSYAKGLLSLLDQGFIFGDAFERNIGVVKRDGEWQVVLIDTGECAVMPWA